MDGPEELVSGLLDALADLNRAMLEKTVAIRDEPGVTGALHGMNVFHFTEPRGGKRGVSVSAYVEANLSGGRGVGWELDLERIEEGWQVGRAVTLRATRERDDVFDPLPVVTFQSSVQLVRALPDLAREWLQRRAPVV